jgi:N-acetylneuraminic acid mutarotase
VGGTYWSSPTEGEPKKLWINEVYRLTPGATQWERLPDYPANVGQLLAVTAGDKVYAIGGRNSERELQETFSMDNSAAGWQRGPDLPRPLFAHGGGALGSVIYVVADEVAMREPGETSSPASQVLALDTGQPDAKWQVVGEVPDKELGFYTAAVLNDALYLFGGATPSGESLTLRDTVMAFDLNRRTWSARHSLPFPLRDASAVVVDDQFVLITGGVEDAADHLKSPDGASRIHLSNRCLLYDTQSDRFIAAQPLRLAVADHGAAVCDGQVLLIAGEDSPYRTRTDLVQSINVNGILQNDSDRLCRGIEVLTTHEKSPGGAGG